MHQGLRIAVVIPAFNEEHHIAGAIARVPHFVDEIIVVDDASHDGTARAAAAIGGPRLTFVRHERNQGVGAAIVTGYRRALALGVDVAAVMAGDGQMDPADLPALLAPIAAGEADYVKGNRFQHREIWREMPASRLIGNVLLSLATKAVSGYWHVFDSQCGYTAIKKSALEALDLDQVFERYGYPNDVLARLHVVGARVVDVPVRPIYGPAWKSGIRVSTVWNPMLGVLARAWLHRMSAESTDKPRELEEHRSA